MAVYKARDGKGGSNIHLSELEGASTLATTGLRNSEQFVSLELEFTAAIQVYYMGDSGLQEGVVGFRIDVAKSIR